MNPALMMIAKQFITPKLVGELLARGLEKWHEWELKEGKRFTAILRSTDDGQGWDIRIYEGEDSSLKLYKTLDLTQLEGFLKSIGL